MRRLAISAVLLLLTATPALAQSKTLIQKLEDQWGAAFNKGDAAAVAAMYAPDAYLMPAGAPLVHGAAADIQSFWAQAMQQLSDVKCTTLDVKPIGRSGAREIGTCTFKTKGAAPQDGALKYAVLWQKLGSEWKLAVDMWNFDK